MANIQRNVVNEHKHTPFRNVGRVSEMCIEESNKKLSEI